MEKGSLGGIVGIVVAIIVVGGLGVLLFNGVRGVLRGADNQTKTVEQDQTNSLTNITPSHKVKMTVRGPLLADQDTRSYSVEISASQRVLNTFTGYTNTKRDEVRMDNNAPAYEQLVYALNNAGFTNATKEDNTETRGLCASGRLYTFQLIVDGQTKSSLWSSTCDKGRRTLAGNTTALRNLLERQIPGSKKVIADLWP